MTLSDMPKRERERQPHFWCLWSTGFWEKKRNEVIGVSHQLLVSCVRMVLDLTLPMFVEFMYRSDWTVGTCTFSTMLCRQSLWSAVMSNSSFSDKWRFQSFYSPTRTVSFEVLGTIKWSWLLCACRVNLLSVWDPSSCTSCGYFSSLEVLER